MTTQYFKVRNGLTVGEDAVTVDAATGEIVATGDITVKDTVTIEGATSGSVALSAPAVAGSQAYTLPTALPGVSGYVLSSDTSGVMSWAAGGGGAVSSVNGQTGAVVLDLGDLDGVTITAPANNDFIQYDSTSSTWTNGAARDGSRIDGELLATRNASFINPLPPSSEVSGTNGIEAASSPPDVAGPLGYGAGFTATLYHGETAAGTQTSPSFSTRVASGTNAAPTAISLNNVMGTYNWNGYSGTDFATRVGTQNGGGGKTILQPLQMQGYANQNFAESTISLATTIGTQSNVSISSVVSSGAGVFTCSTFDVRAYDVVRVTGTLTGTMTFPGYVSGNLYYVTAGSSTATTFTISDVNDGDPVATTAGTTTGLTFTRCRSTLTFAAQTFSPFSSASLVTVAGITPSGFNGSFRAVFGTTTTVGYGNYQAGGNQTVAGTVSIYNVTAGGAGFRVRGFPNSASYNTVNRINFIDANAATATYRSDSFTWQGASSTFNYMQLTAALAEFRVSGPFNVKDLGNTVTNMSVSTAGDLTMRGRINNYDKIYGSFYSSVTQTNPVGSAVNLMTFNTTDITSDVSIVSSSRITIAKAGQYNIQFSAQFVNAGILADDLFVWLRKNGTTVADSAGSIQLLPNSVRQLTSWNYVVDAAAADYYELAWQASSTSVSLPYVAASGNVPGIPSTAVTVVPVGA